MFASSILHICVFLVSFGIIKHLGSMKIYSPDNSGGKTREVSAVMDYDFYFTEYDFCSV
jgi:hypothetical protein